MIITRKRLEELTETARAEGCARLRNLIRQELAEIEAGTGAWEGVGERTRHGAMKGVSALAKRMAEDEETED